MSRGWANYPNMSTGMPDWQVGTCWEALSTRGCANQACSTQLSWHPKPHVLSCVSCWGSLMAHDTHTHTAVLYLTPVYGACKANRNVSGILITAWKCSGGSVGHVAVGVNSTVISVGGPKTSAWRAVTDLLLKTCVFMNRASVTCYLPFGDVFIQQFKGVFCWSVRYWFLFGFEKAGVWGWCHCWKEMVEMWLRGQSWLSRKSLTFFQSWSRKWI